MSSFLYDKLDKIYWGTRVKEFEKVCRMSKNEIIEKLIPKCNGYDLPLSLDVIFIAKLLTSGEQGWNIQHKKNLKNWLLNDLDGIAMAIWCLEAMQWKSNWKKRLTGFVSFTILI